MIKTQGTVLITGAAGFTGRHACNYFRGQGYRVIGAVRSLIGIGQQPGIEYIECDISQYRSVEQLVQRAEADYVLHLGGKNAVKESWEQPLVYMETNVMAVFYLLEALRACGNSARVVLAHSKLRFPLTDQPVPNHPYGLSKSLGGMAALCWSKLFGQEVIIGEPGNLVGPGPSTGICALLAKHIVREERGSKPAPFKLSSGEARRDFLDVRDAIAAYELLLLQGKPGTIYPICSGVERTLRDTALAFCALAKVQIHVEEENGEMPPLSPPLAATKPPSDLLDMGWRPLVSWAQSTQDILYYSRSESV